MSLKSDLNIQIIEYYRCLDTTITAEVVEILNKNTNDANEIGRAHV